MKFYIDNDCRIHLNPGAALREMESEDVDYLPTEAIECYRYVPDGETWTREDGIRFTGMMLSPWKRI